MKKLYLVYSYYGVGGAQRRAAILANEFVKFGYDVTILSLYGSNGSITEGNYYNLDRSIELILLPEWIEMMQENDEVKSILFESRKKERVLKKIQHSLNLFRVSNKSVGRLVRIVRNTWNLRAFFQLNKRGIVICFGFNIFEQVFHSAYKKNKVIYAETNALNKYQNDNNFRDTLSTLKKADALVFQTNQQRKDLSIHNKHEYVIHNPLSHSLPEVYRGKRNKLIVNFCALKRHKNLILLIDSFNQLIKSDVKYIDYKLHLYSDNPSIKEDDYRNEVLQFIHDSGLIDNVKLLPMVSDVHQKIRDCCMFVSSSDYEGISNSMLEAMAIGLPCVCTDCEGGGAREFIVDGYNGLLVERNNADALCSAMKRMLDDLILSDQCSRNAVRIKEELSVENISKQWINVIEDLTPKNL